MAIRVIVADDHKIVRQGLIGLLQKNPAVEVIAEAENGRDALQLVQELSPDVVLMNIAMADLNGIDATRKIVATSPDTRVLALSMHSEARMVSNMLSAGATGYLLKNCTFEELSRAIDVVASGQTYLTPAVADVFIGDYRRRLSGEQPAKESPLTHREREVLQLVAEGKSTKEIASQLFVSIKTIETHRRQIMRKLNIDSIAGLTKYAIREGLTTVDQ